MFMSTALVEPKPQGTKDVEAEFRRLSEWWSRETGYLSNLTRAYEHPAYRQIVALGPAVVPTILRELETRLDWWLGALREITGENPVPPESRGNLSKMAAHWVDWGRTQGLI